MSPDLRLSDAEREEAIEVLSEHVRTGRLDLDEYGTRSAKVTAAKTRSELAPLFSDLPAPRPSVLTEPVRRPVPARRFSVGLVPLVVVAVAVALGVTVTRGGFWALLFLPIATALIFAGRPSR